MEEKLIDAVRQNSVSFDTSHPDYMKAKLKKNIWENIANELKFKNGYLRYLRSTTAGARACACVSAGPLFPDGAAAARPLCVRA